LSASSNWLAALLLTLAMAPTLAAGPVDTGRRIYTEGVLPDGSALTAVRDGDVVIRGADAACTACHRRSGMGSVEGDMQISPIGGNYLFLPPDKTLLVTMDPRRSKSFNMAHEPYDDQKLARAVRLGVHVSGRSMNPMMPRYDIDDAAMADLTAYLRTLSVDWSPGIGADGVIHLATIVAPDADPALAEVLVRMLQEAVEAKNASTVSSQASGRRHMVSAAEMVLGTEHKWQLEVWRLNGPAETWGRQLDEAYQRSPVFAVLSGIAGHTWAPVDDFCQARQLPCWFPLVDAAKTVPGGYALYFSRGVSLEADVLAGHLAGRQPAPRRVVQVYRDDDVGRQGAGALAAALAARGIAVDSRPWPIGDARRLRKLVSDLREGDQLMCWLRPADYALLAKLPPAGRPVYVSARMNGGEHGLPPAWKRDLRLVYPFELPQKRALSLNYFHAWLRLKNIPMVNELLQAEAYFAANFLTDTLAEMLNNLYREYLIERAENMIGIREGGRAEAEARDRQVLRRHALHVLRSTGREVTQEQVGERQSTTVYPRLTLGPGQRYASKGAYIVRFADAHSDALVAESDWLVP
jgi:cytochrome c553